jgi:hypothetical protein
MPVLTYISDMAGQDLRLATTTGMSPSYPRYRWTETDAAMAFCRVGGMKRFWFR